MRERKGASRSHDARARAPADGRDAVIGVSVTFQYDEDFDRARVVSIADKARGAFEGMPGLRSKAFTVDDARRRAMNFYVWESADAARSFFSEEMRERVTGLYGVEPTIDFVEIAQLVDNSGASRAD
jgi:hypothetical protein